MKKLITLMVLMFIIPACGSEDPAISDATKENSLEVHYSTSNFQSSVVSDREVDLSNQDKLLAFIEKESDALTIIHHLKEQDPVLSRVKMSESDHTYIYEVNKGLSPIPKGTYTCSKSPSLSGHMLMLEQCKNEENEKFFSLPLIPLTENAIATIENKVS
ncbi:hypothetical protein [Thalassobacillus sp. CUG 92003]|uniref:hypothetical protein n=1 Tax=Thalassobacillus sp. CUG 92003 TaxID=2736641 RepID=UPI0015E62D16|nr:hypothetical protein [Thalassobacillus sp. CUG 92003]